MIKSEILRPTVKQFNFPCLFEHIEKPGQIILATEVYGIPEKRKFRGTLIGAPREFEEVVGTYSDGWLTSDFKEFDGSVTLKNKNK